MVDIIHRIGIRAPAAQVFEALTTREGLADWWTDEVDGDAAAGGKLVFTFRSRSGEQLGRMVMEVQRLVADQEVRWRCVEGPPEWVGTDITFALSRQDDLTVVIFGHRGWREAVEFMAHCSMKWAVFLLSLRELAETGRGKPSPRDVKIDNWN